MRLWHYDLLPYLPTKQFKAQLREMLAILGEWRTKGKTNHLTINRVMDYPKIEFYKYFKDYVILYKKRYKKKVKMSYHGRFFNFVEDELKNYPKDYLVTVRPFEGWHNEEYLRICMANLYEKYISPGKSKITDSEWQVLLKGYKKITGKNYIL